MKLYIEINEIDNIAPIEYAPFNKTKQENTNGGKD